MKKRETWKQDLRAYLAAQAETPFAEGSTDCGEYSGGAVEAMTGVNPHALVAGKYKTTKGAMRALKRQGFEDHVEYAASIMTELENPMFAQFGDIAAVPGTDALALGIVTGAYVEVRGPGKPHPVPLTDAVRVFRV